MLSVNYAALTPVVVNTFGWLVVLVCNVCALVVLAVIYKRYLDAHDRGYWKGYGDRRDPWVER